MVSEVKAPSKRKLIIGLSRSLPLLVVIIITPLAPRVPYSAVAVASFKIEKLSIASASSEFNSVLLISTPSKIISAPVAPLKVDLPRIQKLAPSAPGSPLRCTAMTPERRPANEVDKLEEGTFNSAGLTCVTAPTKLSFFCPTPKAVTTTSSNDSVASLNSTV